MMNTYREGAPGRRTRRLNSILLGLCGVLASYAVLIPTSALACPNDVFRVEASSTLPDCRAYEQVSPHEKNGFSAYTTQGLPVRIWAPPAPNTSLAIAYQNYQAFPGAEGNTALAAAHVSTRTPGGWNTTEWTPKVAKTEPLRTYEVGYSFSADLTQAVLKVPLVPLTPEATPQVFNLFRRTATAKYSWVNSKNPLLGPEQLCAQEELPTCFELFDVTAFAGASKDFSHVLFVSTSQFLAEAPPTGNGGLYENVEGAVRLVGILPDGHPATTSTAGAGSAVEFMLNNEPEIDQRLENAISEDGSHVVFQAPADEGGPDATQNGLTEVYDRVDGNETIELSAPAPGAAPKVGTPESARFWAASTDGLRVFFTSAAELTTSSNTGSANEFEDLYEYNFNKPANERLRDLTIDTNLLDAATGAMVQGVVNSSSDGSYVYFVAKGQLIPGKGVVGEPNLYMEHEGGAPVFVATLSSAGGCGFGGSSSADSCDWTIYPVQLEAYVTPDGRHLAFMSTMSIPTANFPSGYNNVDQNTGEADSEVYEYTAPDNSGGAGELVCASCDPGGAPPVGNALIGGISQVGRVTPGVQNYTGLSTPFFRVPSVSDNGSRVFYAAPTPHTAVYDKVFEYEHDGEGGCAHPSGCQFLISSPTGQEADDFLGTTSDGGDVFLATSSRLTPTDEDNLTDVYDARTDGGMTAPSTTPECENDCHPANATPGAASLLTAVTGASGNLSKPTSRKPLTRSQKLTSALKVCRAKKNKRRRLSCERTARRRYGSKARKSNAKRRGKS